jgi:hypothetical protein
VYQPTGVKICQPAEGCRVDGDTCRKPSDCCGAAGTMLPGDGNVMCLGDHGSLPNMQDAIGICRNPTGCNPEGDTCHYLNYACGNSSKRNDCCGAPGNSGVCKLDALGVPRCYGLGTSCQMAGQTCASALDCCNGVPCVPDMNGVLHCGGMMCQGMNGSCSNDSDCCNGTTCVFQPGQTYGTCGGTSTCSGLGQPCSSTMMCCAGQGTCEDTTGAACGATEMGCTCQTNQIP